MRNANSATGFGIEPLRPFEGCNPRLHEAQTTERGVAMENCTTKSIQWILGDSDERTNQPYFIGFAPSVCVQPMPKQNDLGGECAHSRRIHDDHLCDGWIFETLAVDFWEMAMNSQISLDRVSDNQANVRSSNGHSDATIHNGDLSINLDTETVMLDVFVFNLRKKLSYASGVNYIETVWGRGHMMPNFEKDELQA